MNHEIYVAKKEDSAPKVLVIENEVYTLEPLAAAPQIQTVQEW